MVLKLPFFPMQRSIAHRSPARYARVLQNGSQIVKTPNPSPQTPFGSGTLLSLPTIVPTNRIVLLQIITLLRSTIEPIRCVEISPV
jgi:hypothetical protein